MRKRSEWERRLQLEMNEVTRDARMAAYFVTLTYNEQKIDKCHSVHQKHGIDFVKRVREGLYRKAIDDFRRTHKEYFNVPNYVLEKHKVVPRPKVSYYFVSEYGSLHGRPHYHAVILADAYAESLIKRCWKFGFSKVGYVRPGGIRYVLKYLDKTPKPGSKLEFELYQKQNLEPPFVMKSRGIGTTYFEKHLDKIREDGYILYKGKPTPLPRYYYDKYRMDSFGERFTFPSVPAEKLRQMEKSIVKLDRMHGVAVYDDTMDSRSAYAHRHEKSPEGYIYSLAYAASEEIAV